jgi:single-strand DNA-binding protein
MSVNTFTFATRIGTDAETKYTQNGKPITTFRCPVETGWGDNKHTGWVTAVLFGERWEKLAQYLTKGTPVTVTGAVKVRDFEHNGEKRTAVDVLVNNVALQGNGQSSASGSHSGTQGGGEAPADGFDSDVPFITRNARW